MRTGRSVCDDSRQKILLSDADLYELFRSECSTFADIAAVLGVTRERVRQIYNAKFRHMFGRKTGRQRIRVCTRKRRSVARSTIPAGSPAEYVAKLAEANGLTCAAIPTRHGARPTRLAINGAHCAVSVSSAPSARQKKRTALWHVKTGARSAKYKYKIAICRDPNTCEEFVFVIPRAVLPSSAEIFIRRVPHRTYLRSLPPRVEWWQYRDAWHLLGANPRAGPVLRAGEVSMT